MRFRTLFIRIPYHSARPVVGAPGGVANNNAYRLQFALWLRFAQGDS
jgi:hypothetical protein